MTENLKKPLKSIVVIAVAAQWCISRRMVMCNNFLTFFCWHTFYVLCALSSFSFQNQFYKFYSAKNRIKCSNNNGKNALLKEFFCRCNFRVEQNFLGNSFINSWKTSASFQLQFSSQFQPLKLYCRRMNHIFTTVQNNRNSSFFRLFSELLWSPSWHWCTSSTSTFTPTQSGIVIVERRGRSGQSTPGRCSHGGRGRRATFKRCKFKSGGRGISSSP